MNMINTTEIKSRTKEKRKRITRQIILTGVVVAKSYVDSFHKKKRTTTQFVYYNSLSYKISNRVIVLTE